MDQILKPTEGRPVPVKSSVVPRMRDMLDNIRVFAATNGGSVFLRLDDLVAISNVVSEVDAMLGAPAL